jgi:hypothetical protein
MNFFSIFQRRNFPVWTAYAAAFIGLALYFVQALVFAHTTVSNLDEGAYLLKGLLFATGKYQPFDPGISTNKAPLAFLIPGYVQLLFGAGLRTGRYLAVFFGVMTVLGTWVAARRLSGNWLAAAAVWVFTFSPMIIKFYSGGATQSTIACLMAWALVLSLGKDRPAWQLILSGILAGMMILVRQNMLPFFPLLVVYAFWQHGWKALGLLISGTLTIAVVFAIYWPDILQLWAWVPFIKIPEQFTDWGGGTLAWAPNPSIDSRLLSIFQAVRLHFIALVGSGVSLLLWRKPANWRTNVDFRAGLFLFLLFWGLLFMHAMAAIGMDYCISCFSPYIAFFNVAGILFLVVSIKSWNWNPSPALQILLVVALLIVFAGMGFSAFEDIGISLLKLPAPRMRNLEILPGFVTWWEILSNKFHMSRNNALKFTSTAFGFSAGALVMSFIFLVWRRLRKVSTASFGAFFAAGVLVLEIVISPVLHGSLGSRDCSSDVILANEQIGHHLQGIIPRGSLVYWAGGLSAAPFLYLPGVNMFPPQINDGYSFLGNGDTARLFKFGFWNEEMKAEWMATADFFIIENQRYNDWKDLLPPDQFDEFPRSPVGTSCLEGSTLRIFHRK